MNWNGFQEIAGLASKWKLSKACIRELTTFLHLEYNAGANDFLEYLQKEKAKEDIPPKVMQIYKKATMVAW